MILFDVTLTTAAGKYDAMAALLRKTMAASQAEPGCLIYRFTADLDDPACFHLVELWDSEAALAEHAEGRAFREFRKELREIGQVKNSVARQGDLAPYQFVRPA